MLEEKIKPEEIELMEDWHNPIALAECMFSNLDNLSLFDEHKFVDLWVGQYPLLSYEYMIDTEIEGLSEKEKFALREGAGNIYCFAARNWGKSVIGERIDLLLYILCEENETCGFSSFDFQHIQGMLEAVLKALEFHPIVKNFIENVKRNPYYIYTKNGLLIESVNMNVSDGKKSGSSFHQKHFKKLFIEEASRETQQVYENRLEAKSNIGCIAKGSKVLMFDFSTKNIEDIIVGDKILGWDENKHSLVEQKVLNSFYSGKKDVIKIQSEDTYNYIWLTPDHKILRKTPGDCAYRWGEAIRSATTYYEARLIPFVEDMFKYYIGCLLGMIEADGHIAVVKGKKNTYHQISIFQASEVEFVEFLLNKLNIVFSKDLGRSPWAKKTPYVFRIMRESNEKIFSWYNDLETNRDIQYGFLAGFIIGDGWLDKYGNFCISQSIKKIKQNELLKNIFKKLNLPYVNYSRQTKHLSGKTVELNNYRVNRWTLPFTSECCNKTKKWKDIIFRGDKTRQLVSYGHLILKGFQEKQDVYDLTTETGNFIVNGFIVHNCVFRILGMTNFTKNSPPGKMFFDPENKSQVLNVPAYINPNYGEKEEKQAIKKYGGKQSIAFRLFVDGDIIQEGVSALDMPRIRDLCYPHDKNGEIDYTNTIKNFEINQSNFVNYRSLIIVDRSLNIDKLFVAADIGDIGGTTEIIIMGLVNGKWRYLYNTTLRNLDNKQNKAILKYIYQRTKADKLGIDATDGSGKAIFRDLKDDPEIDSTKLCWVAFNENIEVGFEKDSKGDYIRENGKLIKQYENTIIWSIQRLCYLLYEPLLFLPIDYKLDTQLDNIIAIPRGNSVTYECASGEDHLWASFEVFAIMQWYEEFSGFSKLESNEALRNKHVNTGA